MKISFLMLFYIFICSCGNGSLNEAKGELHYQNNISKGQELIDLKEVLDKNAITEEEFLVMKQKIIDDVYIKEFFEELNKLDKSEDDTESASI